MWETLWSCNEEQMITAIKNDMATIYYKWEQSDILITLDIIDKNIKLSYLTLSPKLCNW